jgi:phosphoglycolate phosphatase
VKFDLVIMDFDGTLCATHEAIAKCLSVTFEGFGTPAPAYRVIADTIALGIDLRETITSLNPILSENDVEEWIRSYRHLYNSGLGQGGTYLFPGVYDTLSALKESGCKIVIVSNKGEVAIQAALMEFGIASLVDLLVGDRPGLPGKPDAACYREVINPALPNIIPARTLVIGDTAADIRFARNIGAAACWAAYGYGDQALCRALRPEFEIARLTELCALASTSGLMQPVSGI